MYISDFKMITNYSELPLRKYYQMKEVLEGDFDIDQQIKLLSIITDIPEDELFNMKLSKYEQQLSALDFLTNKPVPKSNIPNKILINGKKYRILKDVSKMTAGQYIDIQTYYKENLGYEYILSTILIPEGYKKYSEGYDIQEVINDILDIDIQTAIDVCFFFQKKLMNSIRTTLIYLDWIIKRIKIPQKKEQLQEIQKMLKDRLLQLNGI